MPAKSASNLTEYETKEKVFLLALMPSSNDKEIRLNPDRLDSLLSDLQHAKEEATFRKASALITYSGAKNFCSGFDSRYAKASSSDDQAYKDRYLEMIDLFKKVVAELISLPMPTIAVIEGPACGAGLILAMSHDYLIMEPDKNYLSLSTETDMRMTLPDYFTALIRTKVCPGARGRLALRPSLNFNAENARKLGLYVEESDGSEKKLMDVAKEMAKSLKQTHLDGEAFAERRKTLYPELCHVLGLTYTLKFPSRI